MAASLEITAEATPQLSLSLSTRPFRWENDLDARNVHMPKYLKNTSFMVGPVVLKHMDMDMRPQALLPRFHALTIGPGLGRATGTGEDGLELFKLFCLDSANGRRVYLLYWSRRFSWPILGIPCFIPIFSGDHSTNHPWLGIPDRNKWLVDCNLYPHF